LFESGARAGYVSAMADDSQPLSAGACGWLL
jgi:hypothetical protein